MISSGSKIKIFFIIIMMLISMPSCDLEKNDVIPDVNVYFVIDLVYDPLFFDLAASPGNSTIVTSSTNNWGSAAAGFEGNGIIVYNASEEFFAFDRTCPNCYVLSHQSVAVNIDGIHAVCPVCHSEYVLPSYGTPLPGTPSQYPLKNYHTRVSDNYLTVWNTKR